MSFVFGCAVKVEERLTFDFFWCGEQNIRTKQICGSVEELRMKENVVRVCFIYATYIDCLAYRRSDPVGGQVWEWISGISIGELFFFRQSFLKTIYLINYHVKREVQSDWRRQGFKLSRQFCLSSFPAF